mgnify:CR=1 FL=1
MPRRVQKSDSVHTPKQRRRSPAALTPPEHTEPLPPPQPEARPSRSARIRTALLTWYRRGHRDLPWRRLGDPYSVWLSEIMLQQTRVETVKDYYRRFLERFPTPLSLAEGPLDDVLSLWSGLGYYSRARNLHAAACVIRDQHGGVFPSDRESVHALPGVGPYTAGAILSIAFGQRAPIVDGNVIRVLSRVYAIDDPQESAATKRRLWELAADLCPAPTPGTAQNDPGDFNQAMMELGATLCVPKNPSCLVCPLAADCQARAEGDPERYPAQKREREVPTVQVVTLILKRGREVLLVQRPPAGLWGGLWEPPTGDRQDNESPESALARLCQDRLGLKINLPNLIPLPSFEHVLTHRRMQFTPLQADLEEFPPLRLTGYTQSRYIDPALPQSIGLAIWVSRLLAKLDQK